MFRPADMVPIYRAGGAVPGRYIAAGGGSWPVAWVLESMEAGAADAGHGLAVATRERKARFLADTVLPAFARGDCLEIGTGRVGARSFEIAAMELSEDGIEWVLTLGSLSSG